MKRFSIDKKNAGLIAFVFAVFSFSSLLAVILISDSSIHAVTQTASQTAGPNTISMSNNDSVAIGVVPTSEQAVYTGTNTLSITNSCPNGATITLTTNSNSDTAASNNLVRSGSDDLSKIIAPTTGSNLVNNSWGYSINGGTNYYAVPAKDETPAKIYDSTSATSSAESVNVKYGIKMDNNIPSGNYSNDVIYTVAVKPACLSYGVTWNLDGGTGATGATYPTELNWGQAVNLSTLTPTRDNYTFNGWSNGSDTFTGSETGADVNSGNSRSVTMTAQWTQNIPATLYLYNSGNQYTDITGGWAAEALDGSIGSYSISSTIYISATSDSSLYHTTSYRTRSLVPTKTYNTLYVNVSSVSISNANTECSARVEAGATSTTNHGRWGYSDANGVGVSITSPGLKAIDISEVDVDKYVYVLAHGNCYGTGAVSVSSVYLSM